MGSESCPLSLGWISPLQSSHKSTFRFNPLLPLKQLPPLRGGYNRPKNGSPTRLLFRCPAMSDSNHKNGCQMVNSCLRIVILDSKSEKIFAYFRNVKKT